MPYIDTKYLGKCETCRHHTSGGCNTYCDHGEEYSPNLSKIPTADVVEVVRCEKCEYSKLLIDNENRNHFFRHCRMINAFVKDNSFCSYGVRSEGKEVQLNGIQIRKKLL